MPKTEWTADGSTIEIETDAIIRISHPDMVALDQEVTKLARQVDFVSAELAADVPIDGFPSYIYTLTHRDSREFSITIIEDNETDPLARFNVMDDWRFSELTNQQALLDLLVQFIGRRRLTHFEAVRP